MSTVVLAAVVLAAVVLVLAVEVLGLTLTYQRVGLLRPEQWQRLVQGLVLGLAARIVHFRQMGWGVELIRGQVGLQKPQA